ncbi:MAG TPA: hypothetical protein VH519_08420 [Hyphomicrobiaceae bacterium]|jgi:hypothetical protein
MNTTDKKLAELEQALLGAVCALQCYGDLLKRGTTRDQRQFAAARTLCDIDLWLARASRAAASMNIEATLANDAQLQPLATMLLQQDERRVKH